jgi:hypothetical protein
MSYPALDSDPKTGQEAIEHLCRNCTTIVIAHRLHIITPTPSWWLRAAIVERGRHDDLLRCGGRYASFFGCSIATPARSLWRRSAQPHKTRFECPHLTGPSTNATSYVIPAPPVQAALPVVGESKSHSVRRIWCVGQSRAHPRRYGKTSGRHSFSPSTPTCWRRMAPRSRIRP